ncbi:MAG: hypothetical protein MUF27_15550 [Acidobacteria bacterium]|jgi:hypothetical protein|nr:hypothetical protein [Acidobacteriota bacterium]
MAKAKKKTVRRAPVKAPKGLAARVLALRGEIVQALEVYLDQSDAVLAALEARLGGKGAALPEADAAKLTRALDKLEGKLKPARGRAKDLARIEKLLEEIEEMLDGGGAKAAKEPKAEPAKADVAKNAVAKAATPKAKPAKPKAKPRA